MSGKASTATPLMFITPGILNSSYTCNSRQKPTRLPYSCQHQLGMSGIGEPPAGGGSTVGGMVCVGGHFSTIGEVPTHPAPALGGFHRLREGMGEKCGWGVRRQPAGGFGGIS